MFKNGDIVLVSSDSFLSRAIRFFLREPLEQARFSHVGVVAATNATTLYAAKLLELEWEDGGFRLVEALSSIQFNPLMQRLDEYDRAIVYRPPLSLKDRTRVALSAMQYVGSPYSYRKLLSFLLPRSLVKKLPLTDFVCSTFVASLFFPFNVLFEGKAPTAVSPDDIDDTGRKAGWEIVYSKGV